jgi:uncharacterized OsmC-like protein
VKPLPHHYALTLAGGPTGYAALVAPGLPTLSTAPPVEFDGPGDAWSPEQLLLAAVASCFLFTVRAAALASGFSFVAMEVAVAGTVDRQEGRLRFTEILVRPRLSLPPGEEPRRALRLLEKSAASLVASSLAAAVRLEPEIATD